MFLDTPTRTRRLLPVIFAAAIAIRVVLIFYFDTWHIGAQQDHWSFGFETGRISRSLAEGQGFASPFLERTGPTAWLAPGYPWLLAVLFRWLGVYSPAAALAAFLINSLLSAVTCVVVYQLGRTFFNESTGITAAAVFALAPSSIWHAIASPWDVTISALLFALVLQALRMLERTAAAQWAAAAGFVAAILALFNPTCLAVYAAGLPVVLVRIWNRLPSKAPTLGLLVAVPVLICVPWLIRNKLVLDRFILKSNFGTELRIGNNPLAMSSPTAEVMDLHPAGREFSLYRNLGEIAYVDRCEREALAFIRSHPAVVVKLTVRRVLIFWTGSIDNNWRASLKTSLNWSAAKRVIAFGWGALAILGLIVGFRAADHMLLLLSVVVFPLPYYLTHATNRYRMPLEPILTVLAAHFLVWSWRRWRAAALPNRQAPPRAPALRGSGIGTPH